MFSKSLGQSPIIIDAELLSRQILYIYKYQIGAFPISFLSFGLFQLSEADLPATNNRKLVI